MKGSGIDKIRSLDELRRVRGLIEQRLAMQQKLLKGDLDLFRNNLLDETKLFLLLLKSLSFVSQLFFLRRMYILLRSLLRKMESLFK